MHKTFYASGFLYHPKSEQILLQQKNSAEQNPAWSLFGKKVLKNKSGEQTFIDVFFEKLSIKLPVKNINTVYTYSDENKGLKYNIYYAEVKRLHKPSDTSLNEFGWFNFKQIQKLNLTEQTRQDILIGQRVVDSSIRKGLGQKTIG